MFLMLNGLIFIKFDTDDSKYNEFIKEELANIKSKNPNIAHRDAFGQVAKQWSDMKIYTNKWKDSVNII